MEIAAAVRIEQAERVSPLSLELAPVLVAAVAAAVDVDFRAVVGVEFLGVEASELAGDRSICLIMYSRSRKASCPKNYESSRVVR